jgi:hypothetical protein
MTSPRWSKRPQGVLCDITEAGRPILLICHLDVVEARREDWTTDPFRFVEKDGYVYARGTQDIKDGDAILIATLIRFKREGYVPDRDLIVALTADEEEGTSNGVDWLLKNRRALIDAEYVLNPDSGGSDSINGRVMSVQLAASGSTLITESSRQIWRAQLVARPTMQFTNRRRRACAPTPFAFEIDPSRARSSSDLSSTQRCRQTCKRCKTLDTQAAERLVKDADSIDAAHHLRADRLDAGHANNAPQRARAYQLPDLSAIRRDPSGTRAHVADKTWRAYVDDDGSQQERRRRKPNLPRSVRTYCMR